MGVWRELGWLVGMGDGLKGLGETWGMLWRNWWRNGEKYSS